MPSSQQQPDEDDPKRWLGDTPMLNLRDDKLRLRVQTVLQFSRTDAEKLNRLMSIRMSRKVQGLRNEAGG
jgi:hypothetical protein